MMPLLPELPDFGIGNTEFAIDCHHEPVEGTDHFLGIFLVHAARLVPDYFLPEHSGEFLYFSPPELLRQGESLDMITSPVPCLLRWQGEMLCDQYNAGDEPVPELVYHAKMMAEGIKKDDLEE